MYITGSKAFFEGMKEFVPLDTDKVIFKKRGTNLMVFSENKETTFYWNETIGKQGIKEYILKSKRYEPLCIFLVPDIAKYLEVTIDDIKELQEYFHKCDYKHQYLAIICDSYIENNDFTLTDEQRLKAYNLYRTTRGLDKL
jgi:hypothetical protein